MPDFINRNAIGKLSLVALLSLGLAVACSDDDTNNPTTTGTTSAGGNAGGGGTGAGASGGNGGSGAGSTFPNKPIVGAQIDRAGRPGINTVTNRTFDDPGARATAEDNWNAAEDPASWATSFAPDIAASLAIYDAINNACGTQPAACNDGAAGCYTTLATVLAHDWLTVNGAATEGCVDFLAVEFNALGANVNEQCGGRTPAMDVIDVYYPTLAGVTGVPFGDNVPQSVGSMVEDFPYLAPPNE